MEVRCTGGLSAAEGDGTVKAASSQTCSPQLYSLEASATLPITNNSLSCCSLHNENRGDADGSPASWHSPGCFFDASGSQTEPTILKYHSSLKMSSPITQQTAYVSSPCTDVSIVHPHHESPHVLKAAEVADSAVCDRLAVSPCLRPRLVSRYVSFIDGIEDAPSRGRAARKAEASLPTSSLEVGDVKHGLSIARSYTFRETPGEDSDLSVATKEDCQRSDVLHEGCLSDLFLPQTEDDLTTSCYYLCNSPTVLRSSAFPRDLSKTQVHVSSRSLHGGPRGSGLPPTRVSSTVSLLLPSSSSPLYHDSFTEEHDEMAICGGSTANSNCISTEAREEAAEETSGLRGVVGQLSLAPVQHTVPLAPSSDTDGVTSGSSLTLLNTVGILSAFQFPTRCSSTSLSASALPPPRGSLTALSENNPSTACCDEDSVNPSVWRPGPRKEMAEESEEKGVATTVEGRCWGGSDAQISGEAKVAVCSGSCILPSALAPQGGTSNAATLEVSPVRRRSPESFSGSATEFHSGSMAMSHHSFALTRLDDVYSPFSALRAASESPAAPDGSMKKSMTRLVPEKIISKWEGMVRWVSSKYKLPDHNRSEELLSARDGAAVQQQIEVLPLLSFNTFAESSVPRMRKSGSEDTAQGAGRERRWMTGDGWRSDSAQGQDTVVSSRHASLSEQGFVSPRQSTFSVSCSHVEMPASARDSVLSTSLASDAISSPMQALTLSQSVAPAKWLDRCLSCTVNHTCFHDCNHKTLYTLFKSPPSVRLGDMTNCLKAYMHLKESSSTSCDLLKWKVLRTFLLPEDFIAYPNLFPPQYALLFEDFVAFVEILSMRYRVL